MPTTHAHAPRLRAAHAGHTRHDGDAYGGGQKTRTSAYTTRHLRTKVKGAAHLGVLGGDLEHAVDEEGEEGVVGEEGDPRRTSTLRARLRASRSNLQEGFAQKGVQKDGSERAASIDDGRRRIRRSSPSAMAEQTRLWMDMAAAAKGNEGENGNPRLRGVSG